MNVFHDAKASELAHQLLHLRLCHRVVIAASSRSMPGPTSWALVHRRRKLKWFMLSIPVVSAASACSASCSDDPPLLPRRPRSRDAGDRAAGRGHARAGGAGRQGAAVACGPGLGYAAEIEAALAEGVRPVLMRCSRPAGGDPRALPNRRPSRDPGRRRPAHQPRAGVPAARPAASGLDAAAGAGSRLTTGLDPRARGEGASKAEIEAIRAADRAAQG